ncbi:MAG: DNA methyltransferase [Candidatus Cloacimonadaceae bacterium]|nr:DNA methyltransferase [Candidatus Cloacimonadaceae bacterium]
MKTFHKLIIGYCETMPEVKDESIHLIVTSPPYFNAPFDYEGFYKDYEKYFEVMSNVAKEMNRVLAQGRILVLNVDDMLVDGVKYPITANMNRRGRRIMERRRPRQRHEGALSRRRMNNRVMSCLSAKQSISLSLNILRAARPSLS